MNKLQKQNFIKEYITFPFDILFDRANFQLNAPNEFLLHRARFGINPSDHNNVLISEQRDSTSFTLKLNNFSDKTPLAIVICCKNNPQILSFCLQKIFANNSNSLADILIVDDRSNTNDIYDLAKQYNCSYLRVDNDSDIFSFSVLNNIAAAYCHEYHKSQLLFYNNDIWTNHPETLLSILSKHKHYNADLSGIRLVYPSQEIYQTVFGQYQHILKEQLAHSFNTIQHGGIEYVYAPQFDGSRNIVVRPIHRWRFYDKNQALAKSDMRSTGVTGAFQLIDTELFINLGGYAVSMPSAFQDIDLCLKLLDNNLHVQYIGSEYYYHAETITSYAEKNVTNENILSDALVFDLIWSHKIRHLIGLQPYIYDNV